MYDQEPTFITPTNDIAEAMFRSVASALEIDPISFEPIADRAARLTDEGNAVVQRPQQ